MKNLSSRWAVTALLAPVLIVLAIGLVNSPRSARAYGVPKNKGFLAIGFVSANGGSTSAPSFESLLMNVIAVRLNKSTDTSLSDFAAGWVIVGVPAHVGGVGLGVSQINTGSNFGGNFGFNGVSVSIGEARPEVQVDLNAIQSLAQIFNTQAVPAETYGQAELILDTARPVTVIPVCGNALPRGEGCINYTATLDPSLSKQYIRVALVDPKTGNAALDVSRQQLTPLILGLNLSFTGVPITSTGTYTVLPSMTWVQNTTPTPPTPITNPDLGTVLGEIDTSLSGGFASARPETITAEVAGTNNVVESLNLPTTCNGKPTCQFTMQLPASGDPNTTPPTGGTAYDFYASGKATSYAVRSNVIVYPSVPPNQNGSPYLNIDLQTNPLKIVSKSQNSLSGKITDACNGIAIQAATLQLLMPDPLASPTANCLANPPVGCVAVATAATDEVGTFPLPTNGKIVAQFAQIPADSSANYSMVVTASGYDRTFPPISATGGIVKCTDSTKKGACDVSLNHGFLTGNVVLDAPATAQTNVLVMAEDSGTNNLENVGMVTIPVGSSSATYTMNVPDSLNPASSSGAAVTALDLFTNALDIFNGAPQIASGHTIAVVGDVAAPSPPTVTGGLSNCTGAGSTVSQDLTGITCVGHGGVSGTVGGPAPFTTVLLSKPDASSNLVDLESAPSVPSNNANAGYYALCAPADPNPYTLTHVNNGIPDPSATAQVTLAAPVMVPTAVPTAGVTPTPCPGICDAGQGTQCLICTGTSQNVP
ncbi:MAG TPA: hypothetical protein VND20_02395 [Candidatus Binataceae bacterium]|nr:hypothetical protein [Candidatus Binataceae bacterium]